MTPRRCDGPRRSVGRGLVVMLALGAAVLTTPRCVEAQDLVISDAVVAMRVENREPVQQADSFPATVGEVSFYTLIEGDFGERVVDHVWVWKGEEVARVSLTVHGPRWRTWSSKTIPAHWTGAWEARIEDSSGTVLASVPFTVGG